MLGVSLGQTVGQIRQAQLELRVNRTILGIKKAGRNIASGSVYFFTR